MSETLTYTESTPVETTEASLNEAEQDALAVNENLEKEQGTALLAGKYENAEQLEKAYLELQTKLGSKGNEEEQSEASPEPEPESSKQDEDDTESEVDISFLDELYEQANGEPSEEFIERLEKMDVSQLADMYVQYRSQVESNKPQKTDFTDQETTQLYNVVGGKDKYSQLVQWASKNLSKQEISMYDAVMEKGDANAAYWAIRGLALQYLDKNGYEGKRVSGKAPTSNTASFRSQAELVQAMSDPRYENDDAYRTDVMSKLANSDLSF
tara:strand:+ start:1908 stop:2714 length:807 start_codon:yes stop_codon:yes gene_type:complete